MEHAAAQKGKVIGLKGFPWICVKCLRTQSCGTTTNSFSRGMRNIEGTYTKLRTVYGNSIFVNLFLYFRGYFNNLYKSHPPILPSATQPIHIHCTPTPSQKYEFLIEFPSNTNMNTIRLFQYDRIRIRILVFGLNYSNTIRIPNYSLTSDLGIKHDPPFQSQVCTDC